MRYFNITWTSKKTKVTRTNKITLPNPAEDIGIDAQSALNLFCGQFGGLNKNDIVKIQEIDENGVELGLPITPDEESSIVPTKK